MALDILLHLTDLSALREQDMLATKPVPLKH